MAGTLNKVILIGNVGDEPKIRSTQDGKEIASFPLATSESWKDKQTGEKKEKKEWHKIIIFVPQLVQIIKQYVHKGSKLYIEGSLQTRKWMDNKNPDVERYITEILLQSYNSVLMILSGPNNREGGGEWSGSSNNRTNENNKGGSSSAEGSGYEIEDGEGDEDKILF